MKRVSLVFSMVVVGSMLLAACAAPAAAPVEPPQAPAATEAPAQAPQAEAPTAAPAAPAAPPAAVAHKDVPGDLPSGKGIELGDQSTLSSVNPKRAFTGDRFTLGKFERPYNANTMDVYFPNFDITSANLYQDDTWVYVHMTMVGRDANDAFPGQFAAEVDTTMDGKGEFLVMVTNPTSAEWSTDGVQVFLDQNKDVGGENTVNTDSEGGGDGYETVAFDQGTGNDPDMAWARLSPSDHNSIDMAFKTTLLQGDKTYMLGLWAAADALDPSKFDLNDHYTHEQAGAANEEQTSFYPIKGLAELDNTCRAAMGFVPNGNEPAGCSGQ